MNLFGRQKKRKKILLCTQFINYNFGIIYQIAEYRNRVQSYISLASHHKNKNKWHWHDEEEEEENKRKNDREWKIEIAVMGARAHIPYYSHMSYICLLIAFRNLYLCSFAGIAIAIYSISFALFYFIFLLFDPHTPRKCVVSPLLFPARFHYHFGSITFSDFIENERFF